MLLRNIFHLELFIAIVAIKTYLPPERRATKVSQNDYLILQVINMCLTIFSFRMPVVFPEKVFRFFNNFLNEHVSCFTKTC